MTRLVKADKDIVIMVMCIDTVWDAHVCALVLCYLNLMHPKCDLVTQLNLPLSEIWLKKGLWVLKYFFCTFLGKISTSL